MTDPASPAATPDDPAQDATVSSSPASRPPRRRPPRKTTGAAPQPLATSTQARRLVALLDEIYDRICAPDMLFKIWVPTQGALVRWMVGRCQQRWDKTLPVTARITGPLVDGEMVVDLPLAKNHGELVYPNAAVEKCFDRVCQLVALRVLTAALERQLVTVEATVNGQTVDLTEAIRLPGQPMRVSRQ